MFYKLVEDNTLTYGLCVQSNDYTLIQEESQSYTYPIDGWYWFDTLEEANAFFNISG